MFLIIIILFLKGLSASVIAFERKCLFYILHIKIPLFDTVLPNCFSIPVLSNLRIAVEVLALMPCSAHLTHYFRYIIWHAFGLNQLKAFNFVFYL